MSEGKYFVIPILVQLSVIKSLSTYTINNYATDPGA